MKKLILILGAAAAFAALAAPSWAYGFCPVGMGAAGACPPWGTGCRIAGLLLALAAGYAVLTLARQQPRRLAITGLVIGWFIVAVSAAGLICAAGRGLCRRCHERRGAPVGACPYMGAASLCPTGAGASDSPKPTPKAAAAPQPKKDKK